MPAFFGPSDVQLATLKNRIASVGALARKRERAGNHPIRARAGNNTRRVWAAAVLVGLKSKLPANVIAGCQDGDAGSGAPICRH